MIWAIIWNVVFLFALCGLMVKAWRGGLGSIRFLTSSAWVARAMVVLGMATGVGLLWVAGFGLESGKLLELAFCKQCDRPDVLLAETPLTFVLTVMGLLEGAALMFFSAFIGASTLRSIRKRHVR